ncbi:MAG: cobalamin biosynthesis protein [Cyanobacteria bacterium Co-bin13]|nr:cobalamin biosynthesis protein [Cyanobacteria bacterium Co-bin13]
MPVAGRQPRARRPALWFEQAAVLALAAGLDFYLGDPWGWPHPVQVMGWGIGAYSQAVFRVIKAPVGQRLAGIVLGSGLILGSSLAGWGLLWLARAVSPALELLVGAVLLASCFAGRSLRQAAEAVLRPLQQGNLAEARQQLSRYVGRDTAELDRAEVLRAVMETVTENATDGVLAPLFYAVVGAFLPGVGSVPLALAYKAASTLDSMVGYREAPYTHLGWFSARLEDGLTWLPCRLVVVTIGLLSGQPRRVWRICQRDAIADPSPNAGWSECAYAAALGVQLGGPNRYRGVIKVKPKLADDLQPITPDLIRQAMELTRLAFLIGLCSAIAGLIGWGLLNLR